MKKCFLLFLKPREHNFFENISTFLPNWNIFFFVVENFRGTNFARKRDELVKGNSCMSERPVLKDREEGKIDGRGRKSRSVLQSPVQPLTHGNGGDIPNLSLRVP